MPSFLFRDALKFFVVEADLAVACLLFCHSEPVTDVTGVGIRTLLLSKRKRIAAPWSAAPCE